MSIQQRNIYSGVQVIPWITTENPIAGVLSKGPITSQTATRTMILAVEFGLALADEVQLRKSRSIFWMGSRNHLTGLQEYLIKIPVELSTRAGFNSQEYLVMEKATLRMGEQTETAYYLRAHSDLTRTTPAGTHRAIKLWKEEWDQRESRGPDACQFNISFLPLESSLVELTTDPRYDAFFAAQSKGSAE